MHLLKNRKHDQYYIDQYDRWAIKQLKAIESEEQEYFEKIPDKDKWSKTQARHISGRSLQESAIKLARNRITTINNWMAEDEEKDKLASKTPIPKSIQCLSCEAEMRFVLHLFKPPKYPIIFVFECGSKHSPKRCILPDGTDYTHPKAKCPTCGFELKEEDHSSNTFIKTIQNCTVCGYRNEWNLGLIHEPVEEAFTEEERKRYILDFNERKTYWEELGPFLELITTLEDKNNKKGQL